MAPAADFGEQQVECRVRHLFDGLTNGGEFRPYRRRRRGVVEADDAEITGHVQASAMRDAYDSCGHVVIAGEYRCRPIGTIEELLGCFQSRAEREEALLHGDIGRV